MLLDFPVDISLLLLSSWLELRDLGKVDSAFCNLYHRDELLELWRSKHFILLDSFVLTDEIMIWLGLRDMKTANLKICGHIKYLDDNFLSKFSMDLSKICQLQIGKHPNNDVLLIVNANQILQQLLNAMPGIKILDIQNIKKVSLSFLLGVNTNILNQLTSLKYSSTYEIFNSATIDHITAHCENLLALSLSHFEFQNFTNNDSNLDTNYLAFIRKNPQIQRLTISAINDMDKILNQISLSMLKIQSLSLSIKESGNRIPLSCFGKVYAT